MTTTYSAEHNPWKTDGTLRKRLDKEVHARQLAHASVDLLGVVAAYAGQNYDGTQKTNLFPGRALVTPRSDPARHVKYRRSTWHVNDDDDETRFEDGEFSGATEGDLQQYQQQHHAGNRSPQQQQQQQRRSPTKFEYQNMSELNDMMHYNRSQSSTERGSSAVDMFQAQQAELRGRRFQRPDSPVKRRAGTPPAGAGRTTSNNNNLLSSGVHQQQQQQQQQQFQEMDMVDGNDPLVQHYGLRMDRSKRDLARARQCRYGLGTEKRGMTGPTPVNFHMYPNRPVREPNVVRDKPLLSTDRGFVRCRDAEMSFPHARREEINASMEERRATKSAVLAKAIEELKYQDRAMLVQVPWFYSNHKNAQSNFLGGGNSNSEVAQPDFLLKNVTEGNEYVFAGTADADDNQQQQMDLQE